MIRAGQVEDADAIASVYVSAWAKQICELSGGTRTNAAFRSDELSVQRTRFAQFCESGERNFLVAVSRSSEVVGFVSYGPSYSKKGFGEIMQLYVDPGSQGRGFGTMLLNASWKHMRSCRFATAGVHVWATKRSRANRVYDKVGWKQSGLEKHIVPTMLQSPTLVEEYVAPSAVDSSILRRWQSILAVTVLLAAGLWRLLPALEGATGIHEPVVKLVEGHSPTDNRGVRIIVNPSEVGVQVASCLDGSNPVYFHRKADESSTDQGRNWLLYFQGGGVCTPGGPAVGNDRLPFPRGLVEWCDHRKETRLGSTHKDAEFEDFSMKPLFSRDPVRNPMFHDWHVVMLRYCDGSSFSSPAGNGNAQAILQHLLRRTDFEGAHNVVVSGCSAGAVAAALHADEVKRMLPHANVGALLDSGFFPDWERHSFETSSAIPKGVWPISAQWRIAIQKHGSLDTGVFPASCLAQHAHDPVRCIFVEHLLPFLKVPAFLSQSRYDSSNVQSIDDVDELRRYGEAMDSKISSAISAASRVHGVFFDSCFHHCMSWGGISAGVGLGDGPSQPDAFQMWWQEVVVRASKASTIVPRWEHKYFGNDSKIACPAENREVDKCTGTKVPCLSSQCCRSAEFDLQHWRKVFHEA